MLLAMNRLRRELAWFGANLTLLLAACWCFSLAQAVVLLVTSPDGSVGAGWSGNPVMQVIGWVTFGGWIAAFYSPSLILILAPYRVVVHLVGHPRALAFVILPVGLTVLAGAVMPLREPLSVFLVAAECFGYSLLFRIPGQTLTTFPSAVRGLIRGVALSCVWLVGSIVAVAWAIYRATRGDWTEAGAMIVAGTAGPTILLFVDLFRDDVPGANYIITAGLLASLLVGVAALCAAPLRGRVRPPA